MLEGKAKAPQVQLLRTPVRNDTAFGARRKARLTSSHNNTRSTHI